MELLPEIIPLEEIMELTLLYEEAYRRLDTVTPLRHDCGQLCGSACCQEGEEITGMHLFPGEESLLAPTDFLSLIPTDIRLCTGKKILLAVCRSRCDRRFRPLACRIFPLTYYLNLDGTLQTIVDPRAVTCCPLARGTGYRRLNPAFINTVQKVGTLLAAEPEIRDFIGIVSREIDGMVGT